MKGLMLNYDLGMWDATIQGLKTNTRRLSESLSQVNKNSSDWELLNEGHLRGEKKCYMLQNKKLNEHKMVFPRYQKDEIVYLQEPTLLYKNKAQHTILYKYNGLDGNNDEKEFPFLVKKAIQSGEKWGNKMFMPENRARFHVKITDEKLQRLQDISEQDAIAEGIQKLLQSRMQLAMDGPLYRDYSKPTKGELFQTGLPPIQSYKTLLEAVHEGKLWDSNPWIFSYYFELVKSI
jgi:hypothetical protein